MIKKISITGPESTGKSTLSESLANAYETVWAPEYARSYLEKLDRNYREEDLLQIAKGQLVLQDQLEKTANRYLICDTDLLVIKIWSEHKYGRCHPWILEKLEKVKYDLYILPYIDIPWQEDPLREHPHLREYFYQKYKEELEMRSVNFIEVSGTIEQRMRQAIIAINALPS